jgi:hypothetical protein
MRKRGTTSPCEAADRLAVCELVEASRRAWCFPSACSTLAGLRSAFSHDCD